jgi:formate hydrogenlyase subunit 3/multisubunit Na+/H+ antiporter MnhD subunit
MIGGPFVLIGVLLIVAAATFLLRRFAGVSALLAVLAPLALAAWTLWAPLDEPQAILGRVVVLSDGDRIAIALLFTITSAIFLGVWRSSPGWPFYPIVLMALAALAAALILRPPLNEFYPSFVYSALFMGIAIALTVYPLQGGRPGVTRGAMRFITLTMLSLPALLLADWVLAQSAQSPDSTSLVQGTILLLALGFSFLLALFPFHTWVPAVSREAPPLSAAFALTVFLGTALILLLDVLNEIRVFTSDPRTLELVRGAALVMVGLGAVFAWAQSDFGGVLGYGAVSDMGAILFAIGLSSSTGLAAAFFMIAVRALSVGLMSMGMTLARAHLGDDSFTTLSGSARRLPWTSIAIVVGGLSLAGLPPLAGFAGRWGLLQEASRVYPAATVVLLASGASVAVGVLRGLREMLRPPFDSAQGGPSESLSAQQGERRSEAVLIIAALAVCLFVGLFPGILAPLVREFVGAYLVAAR